MRGERSSSATHAQASGIALLLSVALTVAACSGRQTWEWNEAVIGDSDAWPPYWTVADCAVVADRIQRNTCLETTSRGLPIRPRPDS